MGLLLTPRQVTGLPLREERSCGGGSGQVRNKAKNGPKHFKAAVPA